MRVLQVVKTSDGANWAVLQVRELVRAGCEVHVALPREGGREAENWRATGAVLHRVDWRLPVDRPWRFPGVMQGIRRLVSEVAPDVIHSHFVTTTVAMRLALGRSHPIPRLFQVPGPLHLENAVTAGLDLSGAGSSDHWLASSRYIRGLYGGRGAPVSEIGVSYYGTAVEQFVTRRNGHLRRRLGIPDSAFVVGNVSYMYPPKVWLGQTVGLKCLEDVIDALSIVTRRRTEVVGLIIGGAWGRDQWYERRLRRRASRNGGRILMPGFLPHATVEESWSDFDLVVHVPSSENCGGVHEAMISGVPVIASRVGGLPELVVDGKTGWLVPARRPEVLAKSIEDALEDPMRRRDFAAQGSARAREMFDVKRTAREVAEVYAHLVDPSHSPLPPILVPMASVPTCEGGDALRAGA